MLKKKRVIYRESMEVIDAKNLVFIDESGANLQMYQAYARAMGGERIKMPTPFIPGKKFSLIGAVCYNKVLTAMYGEWATNTEIFTEFLDNYLCPNLQPFHKVILDNVPFHKSEIVKDKIEATGASVIYLPPYSPEFSPIENMWSKIKTILRKVSARTVEEFHHAISFAFKEINAGDLISWFKHCGYILDL
jgi:transposase